MVGFYLFISRILWPHSLLSCYFSDSGQLIGRPVLSNQNQVAAGGGQFGGLFDRLKQQIEQRLRAAGSQAHPFVP